MSTKTLNIVIKLIKEEEQMQDHTIIIPSYFGAWNDPQLMNSWSMATTPPGFYPTLEYDMF